MTTPLAFDGPEGQGQEPTSREHESEQEGAADGAPRAKKKASKKAAKKTAKKKSTKKGGLTARERALFDEDE